MNNGYYVELIGMPASGKSYYCNKIKKLLNKDKIVSNNFIILNKLKKIFFLIIFILKYKKYSIKILKLFFNLDFSKKEVRKHFYYFINEAPLRAYHEYNRDMVINSEGFRYRSLFFANYCTTVQKRKNFCKFIKSQPKVHLLILVKSKKKFNLVRSKSRKKGYKYSAKDIEFYEKNEKMIEKIYKESTKKSSLLSITQENEKKDLKKIVNTIKRFIN